MGSFIDQVISYQNIYLAYVRVKNNYMNIELKDKFEQRSFEEGIPEVFVSIKDIFIGKKEFEFSFLQILNKPKNIDGGKYKIRQISKMSFFDAVVAQCVINVIANNFRHLMPIENYGYKLMNEDSPTMYEDWKRGYSRFIDAEIKSASNSRNKYVIQTDIKNFYPSINKEILFKQIMKYIDVDLPKDKKFLEKWVWEILCIRECFPDGSENIVDKGLPQGPLYSPFLALFYIKDILKSIRNRYKVTSFSYVDDIRIYTESIHSTDQIKRELEEELNKIGLSLSKEKTDIFEVSKVKENEVKLMGKASNLNRAIKDEVILTENGFTEMKKRLKTIVNDISESENYSEEFKKKVTKFVDYRLFKLYTSNDEWVDDLNSAFDIGNLKENFIALWYVLYNNANNLTQKRMFVAKIEEVLQNTLLNELSYIKYVALQYTFAWSPQELMLSDEKIKFFITEYLMKNNDLFIVGALSKLNKEWIEHIKSHLEVSDFLESEKEKVLQLLNTNFEDKRSGLYFEDKWLRINSPVIQKDSFIKDEKLKGVTFKKFKPKGDKWELKMAENLTSLNDFCNGLTDDGKKEFLKKLFIWIDIQLRYSDANEIPVSICDPNHIWVNTTKKDIDLVLLGNPLYENNMFNNGSNKFLWHKALMNLFEVLFKVKFRKKDIAYRGFLGLPFWQFRILNYLTGNFFDLEEFVTLVISAVSHNQKNFNVTKEYVDFKHLIDHYLPQPRLQDRLLQIVYFVHNNWKNGSKELTFYTMHNHEHGFYLVNMLHNIMEKSGFSIYLNQKESFRLFAGCYLHDLGMLSPPSQSILFDTEKEEVSSVLDEVESILEVAATGEESKPKIELPYIYDIYSEVDQLREKIVRDHHPYVSEFELVSDYPKLPLSVAERRDIGIISMAHGENKIKVESIINKVHDGKHPIRLQLLSFLLRLGDLTDVTKERVTQEVLERRSESMSEVSIFHWIKHLSVDDLKVTSREDDNGNTVVHLEIEHNYLPNGKLDEQTLKNTCGSNCKLKHSEEGLEDFFEEGKKEIDERGTDFKYFNKRNCNITCAFVNDAYKWFYTEIVFLNRYFQKNGINLKFDISIIRNENSKSDFNYVENRNITKSAQEFMMSHYS